MSMQTKTIGRMPTDHGSYDPQLAYGKKFQCTLFGCSWESLHDNNNTAPAVWDGGDVITPNLVDWKKVSGSYEAWLMNKDKPATTGTTGAYPYNGMGRVVIPKKMVNGVNTLTHEAFEDSEGNDRGNTIYVIQYDFTLGEDITIPANCELEFAGGSISGNRENKNTITGANTYIKAPVEKIFNNIILDGTFVNDYLYIEQFGITTGSGNAAHNADVFTYYIIPSCNNTNVGVMSLKDREYYVSAPLLFNGEHDVLLYAQLIYTGAQNATFVTIGTPSNTAHFRKKFSINIKQEDNPNYVLDGESGLYTIPENYGVKFVDVSFCEIEAWVNNFAYAVSLLALSPVGVVGNIFNRVCVRGKFYCGLQYKSTNQGWVNENIVYEYHQYVASSNVLNNTHQVIGICIDASDEGHESSDEYTINSSNNNVFIKPCVQSAGIGVFLKNARCNSFISLRNEAVYTTLVTDSVSRMTGSSKDNVIILYGNSSINNQIKYDITGNSCINFSHLGQFKNLCYKPIKYVGKTVGSQEDQTKLNKTSCEVIPYRGSLNTNVFLTNQSGPCFGYLFDVRNIKTIGVKSNVSQFYIRFAEKVGSTYNFINSEDIGSLTLNKLTVKSKDNAYYFQLSYKLLETIITFSNEAEYVFIGVMSHIYMNDGGNHPENVGKLTIQKDNSGTEDQMYEVVDNPYITYSVEDNTPIESLIVDTGFKESIEDEPNSTYYYKIGNMLFVNGVPRYWNGTAWVDSHGNAAGTVYPKVIGTPTTGNIAKFNGTDIEDAGTAPQV